MGAIDVLYSSPIPVSLAIGFNLILLAVGWLFVLPLHEEVKSLRKRAENFDNSYSQSVDAIKKMQDDLDEILGVVKHPDTQALTSLAVVCDALMSQVNDIRNNLGKEDPRERAELLNLLETLERNSERILRTVSDVSDKQSQVTGLMIGLGMQRGNPPRGV
jgi:molybdenum-dependent DNA-binding transcriptional regulator ModE